MAEEVLKSFAPRLLLLLLLLDPLFLRCLFLRRERLGILSLVVRGNLAVLPVEDLVRLIGEILAGNVASSRNLPPLLLLLLNRGDFRAHADPDGGEDGLVPRQLFLRLRLSLLDLGDVLPLPFLQVVVLVSGLRRLVFS